MSWRATAGHRISIISAESGLKQYEFANRLGFTETTMSAAIHARTNPIRVIEEIHKKYFIPMEYFFTADDRNAEYILHPERKVEDEKELHPTWEQYNEKCKQIKELEDTMANQGELAKNLIEEANANAEKAAEERDDAYIMLEAYKAETQKTDVRPIIKALTKAIEDLAEVL